MTPIPVLSPIAVQLSFSVRKSLQHCSDSSRHHGGTGATSPNGLLFSILMSYLPTKCPKSFSFSSQTYSISSVSVRVNSRFTVHGLV
jgi:hypothetical protein